MEQRVDYNKLFDDKVALSADYQFGGGDGGERWRLKTRGYFVSKCHALLPILDWAEKCDQKRINPGDWEDPKLRSSWVTELGVTKLSAAVWGFLNTC